MPSRLVRPRHEIPCVMRAKRGCLHVRRLGEGTPIPLPNRLRRSPSMPESARYWEAIGGQRNFAPDLPRTSGRNRSSSDTCHKSGARVKRVIAHIHWACRLACPAASNPCLALREPRRRPQVNRCRPVLSLDHSGTPFLCEPENHLSSAQRASVSKPLPRELAAGQAQPPIQEASKLVLATGTT